MNTVACKYTKIGSILLTFWHIKDNFITHLFLCVKYYIYVCKFRGTKPTFIGYTPYIKSNRETEYYIAKQRGKLSNHLKTMEV